jgi:hypothetical protein
MNLAEVCACRPFSTYVCRRLKPGRIRKDADNPEQPGNPAALSWCVKLRISRPAVPLRMSPQTCVDMGMVDRSVTRLHVMLHTSATRLALVSRPRVDVSEARLLHFLEQTPSAAALLAFPLCTSVSSWACLVEADGDLQPTCSATIMEPCRIAQRTLERTSCCADPAVLVRPSSTCSILTSQHTLNGN